MSPDNDSGRIADIIGRSLLARSLTPLVLCLTVLTAYLCVQQLRAAEAQSARFAEGLAALVQTEVEDAWAGLAYFANKPHPDRLADMVAVMPSMERLAWVDGENTVVAMAPETEDLSRRFLLSFEPSPENNRLLSRPLPSPRGDGVTVLLGVRNVAGMLLVGELDLREVTHSLAEIGKAWPEDVIVCDRFGNLISHPDRERVLRQENIGDSPLFAVGQSGETGFVYREDGAFWLGAAAKAPRMGWLVLVRRSAARALAPAFMGVAAGTAFMGVALIAFTLLVRRELDAKIAHPMQASTARLARADAESGVLLPAGQGFAELQRFERAVEDMAGRILADSLRLQESERRFRAIFEQSGVGMVQCDAGGRFLRANAYYLRLTGYDREGLAALNFADITHPDDLAEDKRLRDRLARGEIGPYAVDKRYLRPDGSVVWVNLSVGVVRDAARTVESYVGVAVDITDRKLAQQAVDASLREKETLLREIHHRVKNNLQIISSLLSLQADQAGDPWIFEQFALCRDRVASMALIHEELYGSTDLALVNVRHYAERLAPRLVAAYRAERPVRCTVEADDVNLAIDQAIPFGLILNELVTNAAKHAFREQGGVISVSIRRQGGLVRTLVSDDGQGLPPGFDPAGASTLGLSLVNQLVLQLHGELAFGPGPGASVSFCFSVKGA